jgi:Caspase domain
MLAGLVVGCAKTSVAGYPVLRQIDNDVALFKSLLSKAVPPPTVLQDDDATVNAVHEAITNFSNTLKSGDTFVFAFSGHGGQFDDPNSIEGDKKAEAIMLADGPYPDATLRNALHGFDKGVDVVALIDACHGSGVVFIDVPEPADDPLPVFRRGLKVAGVTSLTMAAAGEGALAKQGTSGGQLVACLREAWKDGAFKGTWGDLWDLTSRWAVGLAQTPQPEAWLDGPDDDDSILTRPALQ